MDFIVSGSSISIVVKQLFGKLVFSIFGNVDFL